MRSVRIIKLCKLMPNYMGTVHDSKENSGTSIDKRRYGAKKQWANGVRYQTVWKELIKSRACISRMAI